MAKKIALIFGATGQDGYFLTKLLNEKGYEVHGAVRRVSSRPPSKSDFKPVDVDITDAANVNRIIRLIKPDEIYNLAAQSHVAISFTEPAYTWEVTAKGCLNILEAIRNEALPAKFFQASSSEMFGGQKTYIYHHDDSSMEELQNEVTPFYPRSPYAVAKLAAHNMTRIYREAYKIFACSGIMFNHESEHRGENFVTRKITKYVAKLSLSLPSKNIDKLRLGNINIQRDWGHAEDFVRGMYMMLQAPTADDYILATGVTHTLEDFLSSAFGYIGEDWKAWVEIDPTLYRPSEVPYCRGDAGKIKRVLGWSPKIDFNTLVHRMVESDLANESRTRLERPEV